MNRPSVAAAILILVTTVSAPILAAEVEVDDGSTDSEAETPQEETQIKTEGPTWFRHFGIAFRASAGLQSTAVNQSDFKVGYVLGPELLISAFNLAEHSVLLGFAYQRFGRNPEKGSAEIKVKTKYDRLDLWLGYDFNWEMLVTGIRIGTGLMFVGTETSYGSPNWEIYDTDGDGVNEIVFTRATDPDVRVHNGIDPGFLVGLGLGVSLGKHLFDRPGLIEIRAQSDYLRRGNRNEFTVGGQIVFWPTKLFTSK